ncbi:zinc metallopeptidase, M23 family [Campylobacter iguaniorum]|uniref:M23 family metallopeptidase n=1 Tax=Campylobacter iguaniorum TaxID=1244531 RepID=UPI00073A082A|nr:zinc metallopeptidase, M23 family [Campylobacter iguaniorum]
MRKILFFLLFFSFSFGASITNGEIEIITIESQYAGNLSVNDKKLPWIPHPTQKNQKIAFIPAGYYDTKGITVTNSLNGVSGNFEFDIAKKNYKKEKITVDNAKVNPPKSVLKRIAKEKNEANAIYRVFGDNLYFDSKFMAPMNSFVTSEFGTARVFNNQVKSYHSGMDFRAPIGQNVLAANDGIVKIAKDRYYAGNGVVIDHGGGIYTQYYHLSNLNVKVGDKVKKGDIIGLSGNSGRVSGPHLHFGVMVSGVQVSPVDFIEKINGLF